ncbi:MAG TPA: FAD-dependent oxidoreductase [Lachnospiraceae bacterium]|nr:FAD-dependent oxidoreductase [Lachnospiraceae bacterium]
MQNEKTIRISQIRMPVRHTAEQVIRRAIHIAGGDPKHVTGASIVRQSLDARKKDDIHYIYAVDLTIERRFQYQKRKNVTPIVPKIYDPQVTGREELSHPVTVVGSGPAGLFCAYLLAKKGYRPLLLERGPSIDQRMRDVERFWDTGELNPESNVQFGEGGAGTFSDGKLNTLVKDKYGRNRFVLETFVRYGAPESILYEAKPHIGTDRLVSCVSGMREAIRRMGGTVRFESKVTGITVQKGRLTGLTVNEKEQIPVTAAVFCIGHSARDTFAMLHQAGVPMQPKAFAVGLRIEHPQAEISCAQYGSLHAKELPPAPYKLTHQTEAGRGVYTFCMCPGGYVVNASSEPEGTAVNGMSYHGRNSANANSAVIVTVTPEDFSSEGYPLNGIRFQKDLEHRAWLLGKGSVPQQLFADFETNTASRSYGSFASCLKGQHTFANLRELLPETLNQSLIEGIHAFSHRLKGFDREDAILSGVESRTSSPVRITRNSQFESELRGFYPCGEGAGYAGGIMSSAMDGLKCAEAVMQVYLPV